MNMSAITFRSRNILDISSVAELRQSSQKGLSNVKLLDSIFNVICNARFCPAFPGNNPAGSSSSPLTSSSTAVTNKWSFTSSPPIRLYGGDRNKLPIF
jgi:hypothetical protein